MLGGNQGSLLFGDVSVMWLAKTKQSTCLLQMAFLNPYIRSAAKRMFSSHLSVVRRYTVMVVDSFYH